MTDILLGVSSKGTGKKLKSLNFQIASKTGTTQRENSKTNTDATFVSYTGKNVLLVWAGNADMKPENDLPKGTVGGGILGFITRDIHRELAADGNTPADFIRPNSVVELSIDIDDLKKGDIRIVNPLTPTDKTKKALFSVRFAPTEQSENYLSAVAPKIDGQIINGTAEIWFDTLPQQTYEIYKNGILQEALINKNGEYRYTDKYPNGTDIYNVSAKMNGKTADSNEITLYMPLKTQNVKKEKQKDTRPNIPWYF
jgi:membrane peptidoglycan carboxypeptidase